MDLTSDRSAMDLSQASLTKDQIEQVQKILSTPAAVAEKQKEQHPSTFWTIFWIISLPPLGWFMMRRFSWPWWVKVLLIVTSAGLYVWAAIETEAIAFQITNQFSGIDSNLLQ